MIKRLAKWWKQRQQDRQDALMFERKIIVSFNDAEIRAIFPDGTAEGIESSDARRIFIETKDTGPAPPVCRLTAKARSQALGPIVALNFRTGRILSFFAIRLLVRIPVLGSKLAS